ncbi:MAG: DUF3105 domain-containing protein [Chloroflexia bacterium]|nr:DUF3105 domain-containing protein [Chloroflexia bacterium]
MFDTIEIEDAADTETETETTTETETATVTETETETETETDTGDQAITDDELLDAVTVYDDVPAPPDFATHVEGTVDYEQDPPAGGDHAGDWQSCGFYDEPVINEQAVHSLEHGAVWITYDPELPEEDIAALEELADGQTHLLISPYEDLPSPIVASAWGVQLEIEGVDDPYLPAFIDFFLEGPQTPEPGAPCEGGSSETA